MARKEQLFSVLFLSSVALLVANDLFLKYYFHNTITGKLSDFAGLFAFPYFFSVLCTRAAKHIYYSTTVLFIVWKSELVQPLLNTMQGMGIGINRVVDYSDLAALLILPLSYNYFMSGKKTILRLPLIAKPVVVAVCCFAFVATTVPRTTNNINLKANLQVNLKANQEEVINVLKLTPAGNDAYSCIMDIPDYTADVTATVRLREKGDGLLNISLDSIVSYKVEGGLFTGIDEDDVEAVKKLTVKDYEKLFIKQKFALLYPG